MQPSITKKTPITLIAETNFRNRHTKFGIKLDDRRRHMYLLGKTGMGKSTTLEHMIIQDILEGKGVAIVDPHGDLAEKIVDFIPSSRINDTIYFNPSDIDFPIAFNVLEKVESHYRHLVASGLIGVFKKIWADSWGPRLEYVLRNAILALLDYPDSTLLGVTRLLVDKAYRKKVISKVSDPVVKSFWVDEYSKYPDKFATEAIAPIQNKVGQFLSSSLIRNIVGQVKSTVNIREVMDQGKILILNLSKGRIGEDNSALLGAMMITKIQLAAMSRVDVPEEERRDFYLYVDEFQNFATESFANILSEARKYRLNLIIAHQYIEQLSEEVQAAVFGNVGTIMCFRIGAADAEFLVKEFEPYFTEEDLVNLAKYDVYMKLMIDGISSNPFSARTLPPITGGEHNHEKIINVSRERYARPRSVVEDKIIRWAGMAEEEEEEVGEKPKKFFRPPEKERFEEQKKSFEKGEERIKKFEPPKASLRLEATQRQAEKKEEPVRQVQKERAEKIKNFVKKEQEKSRYITPPPIRSAQPVVKEQTAPISLKEALTKPLTPFKGKKISESKEKSFQASSGKNKQEQMIRKPLKEEKLKKIQPGQVIKF